MAKRQRIWDGGYVRKDAKGRDVYVIRRRVQGRLYEISTRCHGVRAALEQLKRFEANPEDYSPAGEARREPLYLTDTLAQKFLDWSRTERKNSRGWLTHKRQFITWWAEKLHGLDLCGGVSLTEHIHPALNDDKTKDPQKKDNKNRHHRIAVLKNLFSWLRRVEHKIEPQQDPTLDTLAVPQSTPEQWIRVKTIPREHYLKARSLMAQHWRDATDVQVGTGWHVTETIRFAEAGEFEEPRVKGSAGVLLCPQTKSGAPARTAVSKPVLEAAKRLRAYGSFTYKFYNLAIREACQKAGVVKFTPGRWRHTVASWAIDNGESPEKVAAFLNHKDKRTTNRFYATHAVPAKIVTLESGTEPGDKQRKGRRRLSA